MATAVLVSRMRKGSARPFNRRGRGGGRAEEGAAGAGREARGGRGLGAWRGGHPRGARRRGKGGRGELRGAREGGLGQYQGRGSSFGRRRDAWGGQVAGAGVRRRRGHGAGKLEVGETVRGSVVNNPKFQNQFCNFHFSPSSWPQMKKC